MNENLKTTSGENADITDRKKAEGLLQKERAMLNSIIDLNPYGIQIFDAKGHYVRSNQAFFNMFQAVPPADYCLFDDPIVKKAGFNEKVHLAVKEGKAHMNPEAWYNPHWLYPELPDKLSCFRSTVFPVMNAEGKMESFMVMFEDITDRKKAEETLCASEKKYRQLVETLQEGIWVIDKDSNTTFANPHMAKMLGYTVEEMLGKPLFNFMDERGVEIAKRNVERRKRGIAEQHDFEFIRKDGSRIYTTIATTPVLDEKGNYVGALAGVNDITERKKAQEKLLAAEKLAVMGRLTADVTHEVNNPLAIIIGGTQLVLSRLDKKSSPFKKQLETVLRNAKRCKTILGSLLGYNRTIGKKEESINLPALIREAIKDVGYQYDMSGIETVFNCNEIANAEITGNSTALLSVFINLIRNARQAMGEKGRLTITMQKEDEKHLRIEIHDTGSGMNAKQKAELFKPFASGWKERDGSGLGLATSLGIIETHGGSMSAESGGVGKGAVFTILLPCEFKEKKE